MNQRYVFSTTKGDRLLTVPEVAALCNCTPQAVHRAVVEKRVKAQWFDPPSEGAERRLLFRREWVTAWRRGRRRAS